MEARKIMFSAGEPSGDRLGAGLAKALRNRLPDVELVGMGGERMAAAGVRLVQDSSEVAVVGLLEVVHRLPEIRRAMKRLEAVLRSEKPDLLVPIDFPDFNLRLAARAGRAGVPVVYFVSPQIWAWRRGRVRKIRRLVRRMLVLFPFETAFYEEGGVPVSFVGHPVMERGGFERTSAELRAAAGLEREGEVLALLPGSRRDEVRRLLPAMLDAAIVVRKARAGTQTLVLRAPGLPDGLLERMVSDHGGADVRIHAGDFPEILTACDAGVVASGTASLEAAAMGLPMVVVYRMNPISFLAGRLLIKVKHIALPNLIAGRKVVPELLQGDCNAEAIAREILGYLEQPERTAAVRRDLAGVCERLGGAGIFDRAAEAVLREIGAGEP
jgi:lipid-A-disaccharide synthase